MRARSFMFPHQLLALGAVLILGSACGTRVVNGIGTGGGTTSTSTGKTSSVSTGTQGTGGAGGNTTVTVSTGTSVGGSSAVGGSGPGYLEMAIRWADLPPINTNTGTTVASTGSSGGPDPDSMELLISDHPIICGPDFWTYPCDSWRVDMLVPPQLLVVGMPVPFSDLNTTYSETGSGPPMNCGGSSAASGGMGPGTFEVLAMDATTITYRLTGVNVGVPVDINGDHVATRCVP